MLRRSLERSRRSEHKVNAHRAFNPGWSSVIVIRNGAAPDFGPKPHGSPESNGFHSDSVADVEERILITHLDGSNGVDASPASQRNAPRDGVGVTLGFRGDSAGINNKKGCQFAGEREIIGGKVVTHSHIPNDAAASLIGSLDLEVWDIAKLALDFHVRIYEVSDPETVGSIIP